MKIVVVGLGYVGLSNAVLLAQYNEVIGVDISRERVDALNERKSPIIDAEVSHYLTNKDLNIVASMDLVASVVGADYVIVSTPTDYDEKSSCFDTSSVEQVIAKVIQTEEKACIVVKSTIPVGFTDYVRRRFATDAVIFSPEFLREGKALYDNLYPSRIVVGERSARAEIFATLLVEGALKKDINILFTEPQEAEAIKLFSNTYLAMRVAFFNELDSYSLGRGLDSEKIIEGVSCDPRVGNHYNNPSFGYGGYCLPKDTKQLLANYDEIPQNLIKAVVEANETRKDFLTNKIIETGCKEVGVYRLTMKTGSDNFKDSSVLGIIHRLVSKGIAVTVYEPSLQSNFFLGAHVENNFNHFKAKCELIIANRMGDELDEVKYKVFTRDIFLAN